MLAQPLSVAKFESSACGLHLTICIEVLARAVLALDGLLLLPLTFFVLSPSGFAHCRACEHVVPTVGIP